MSQRINTKTEFILRGEMLAAADILERLRGNVAPDLSKFWIWSKDEIRALEKVIAAVKDCI